MRLFTTGIKKENTGAFMTYFETLIWTVNTHGNVINIKTASISILFLAIEVKHMHISACFHRTGRS